jgi:hypothetical protein
MELHEVFGGVYREHRWGRRMLRKFFSGPGSHDPEVVEPYVEAMRRFLGSFPQPPDVADLGCGDFNVGRQLRASCGRYVACDIVPDLIAHNSARHGRLNVDFRCLNLVEDPLPEARIALVRQVLQHLSNEQIARIVPKLARYELVVLTEHLPATQPFIANADQQPGSGIRLTRHSGVVLTEPPFGLRVRSQRRLCATRKYGGLIVTDLYAPAS